MVNSRSADSVGAYAPRVKLIFFANHRTTIYNYCHQAKNGSREPALVIIGEGKHTFPSRTRSLSPQPPMVVRPLLSCESRSSPVLWSAHSERRERTFFYPDLCFEALRQR